MKTLSIILGIFIALSAYGQDDSWILAERSLPINETFEAGTKVVFVIDYEVHSVVGYTNLSDAPAKVIFFCGRKWHPTPG